MDIVFQTNNLLSSLLLMLLGMVGIFVVMGIIMAAVALLNKFAKDKPDQNELSLIHISEPTRRS